jgi:large conductance mechanosensitive channel
MAIGIIIGGAFGLIVRSMIDDLVMPIVGLTGKAEFQNFYLGLTDAVREGAASYAAEHNGAPLPLEEARALGPVLAYGNFITVAINFLILAIVIFFMVKAINQAKKQFEEEKKAEPSKAPAADVVLLGEIRDLLKQQNG